jgi:hypothetical protein
MERSHTARWTCPECGTSLTSTALDQGTAAQAAGQVAREHLELHGAEHANPRAAASWLAGAGQQLELWGGPFDGATLWCPPGELPDVVGMHRTADGALVPIRSATARLMPHVESYRLGEPAAALARGRLVRYLHDSRPR